MTLRRDDRAVSTVVGAVLIFGLLVLTLVTVKTQFVPVWDEEREAKHMGRLADQLAVIKADLDRQVANATAGSLTDPLTLRSEGGFTFFQGTGEVGGIASFTPSPSGQGVQLTSPQLRIQVRSGQVLFGLEEQWTAITTGDVVGDVLRVDHLRIRVDMAPKYVHGQTATLTVHDAAGNFAGRAVVTFLDFPSEQALEIRTYNANNVQMSVDTEAFFQQTGFDYLYFDLLDPALLFNQVLGGAEKPLVLTMSRSGLVADYTIAYAAGVTGGGVVGGGGLVVPNYAETMPSGRLVVDARNQQFPNQRYTIEHGAVILEQDAGAVFVAPPQFFVSANANVASVDWLIPGLSGGETTIGGSRSAAVGLQPFGARQDLTAAAARISFVLPTDYPALWADHLRERLTVGGLSDAGPSPQFTVTTGTSSVQLDLFGPISTPGDTTEDIALRFRQATIEIQLRPSA